MKSFLGDVGDVCAPAIRSSIGLGAKCIFLKQDKNPNGFSTSTEYFFCFSFLVFFKLGTHFFSMGFPPKKNDG